MLTPSEESTYQHEQNKLIQYIKENTKDILQWRMPAVIGSPTQDIYLDELQEILTQIKKIQEHAEGSVDDLEFLKLMEHYYYVVAQKTNMDPELYKEYLRSTREALATFYLKCVLHGSYDITKNPLKIPLSEILSVCGFIGKKFRDASGIINWEGYFNAYILGNNLKLVRLLEEVKQEIPNFDKKQINMPLLMKIFDVTNAFSEDVFGSILFEKLRYTREEITKICKK